MSVHSCYSADDWAKMTNCKVRVDGAWKQCKSIHANVDGAWKRVWPETIVLSIGDFTVESDNYGGIDGSSFEDALENAKVTITVTSAPDGWVVPSTWTLDGTTYDESTLVLGLVDSDGNFVLGSNSSSYGASFVRSESSGSNSTWTFGHLSDSVVTIPFGTYSWVLCSYQSDGLDNYDIILNSGIVTVRNYLLTVSTSDLTLEGVTTVGELETALSNAGFVLTASNFPDGWVVPSSGSTGTSSYSQVCLYLLNPDGSNVVDSTGTNVYLRMVRGTYAFTDTVTYGSDTTWGFHDIFGEDSDTLPAGVYSLKLGATDGNGLDDFDITFNSGTITVY